MKINKNSETYRLIVTETVEFLLWCLQEEKLNVQQIQTKYLSKELNCLSYGALLQQLINDHVKSYERLAMKTLKESDYV
jgi:hypothetical protein|tara:strand:+ start:2611 stop:2847 length:237 start_codon:yes stop_codon:yes gene_type:complete